MAGGKKVSQTERNCGALREEARRLTTQSEESLKSARLIWLKKEVSRKNSSNAAEFSVWPSVGSAGRGPTSAWWHQSVEISSFC